MNSEVFWIPSHFKALRQVWWWKLPPLIILCLFEQREEPCRFKVKKGCLDLSGCTWVVCLHPHLTMCYLFAAVYIYCSVRAPKVDHSREQRVFMFVFFLHHASRHTSLHSIFPSSFAFWSKIHFKLVMLGYTPPSSQLLLMVALSSDYRQSACGIIMNLNQSPANQINGLNYFNQEFLNIDAKKGSRATGAQFNRHKGGNLQGDCTSCQRDTVKLCQASVSCTVSFSYSTLLSHLRWLPVYTRTKYCKETERPLVL